jgi:hypothetical protein
MVKRVNRASGAAHNKLLRKVDQGLHAALQACSGITGWLGAGQGVAGRDSNRRQDVGDVVLCGRNQCVEVRIVFEPQR